MEIIDTLRKALRLQIHTVIFIFPSREFRALWLSRNCFPTLQFSFRHTFPPPQLWRVFFPVPNKGTGSLGRDFASQISLAAGREGRGWVRSDTRSGACLQPGSRRRHVPVPGSLGWAGFALGCCPIRMLKVVFLRAGTELGASTATSFPWHWWLTVLSVVTELSTQGSLSLKQLRTPLVFPAPWKCTPRHWAGIPLRLPLCPMQDVRCRMTGVGCRTQDAGCSLLHSAASGGGKGLHPKPHLLLTHSTVNSRNKKAGGCPHSQSCS